MPCVRCIMDYDIRFVVVRLPDVGLVAVELVDVGLMLVLWTMNALWTKFEHYVIF